ncbi:hypothetical protein FRX31_032582 [Thalictrum thalictroides]|uniref:Uncharacterized protein n=1 Tax=Thalictrum thalictroides TaxID=46969 RepID=A0A7J6UZF0_THATH|nr:hypothetical protein FRX31_032582 [Thalictrum thalictroides]
MTAECTQPLDYANELVRSLIDRLDLAVDRRISAVELQSRRRLAEGFRSSPELSTDSPIYHRIVNIASPPVPPAVLMTAEIDARVETAKCLRRQGPSLIHALDLAGDRRVTDVEPQSRRGLAAGFRSSPELFVHSPVYGAVNTVSPVETAVILPIPARPDRRRSVWKRSKRVIWRSMVNIARRLCFCQTFVDME